MKSRHLYKDNKGNILEVFLFKSKNKKPFVRVYRLGSSTDSCLYTLDEFNNFHYQNANESQKCEQCGKASGYDFYCKKCQKKRTKELQNIASEIQKELL